MDREREHATLELLRAQEFRLHELMTNLPEGASVPQDELIMTMVKLEDLRNELELYKTIHRTPMNRTPSLAHPSNRLHI